MSSQVRQPAEGIKQGSKEPGRDDRAPKYKGPRAGSSNHNRTPRTKYSERKSAVIGVGFSSPKILLCMIFV